VVSVFGRNSEILSLDDVLSDGASAGSSTVVLEGEAGIGKTTLWEYGVESAMELGWTVLVARMSHAEAQLTYVGLGDLLTRPAVERVVGELPVPLRRGLEAALLWAEPDDGPLAPHAVAVGFLGVLERLSGEAPVLIAIDDAHWLDRESAVVLGFAARRLVAQRVVMLLAIRSDESEPFPTERVPHRLVRIGVGPLSLDALQELVRARTGSGLRRRRLAEIGRLSGGNPLFALELARAAAEGAESNDSLPSLPKTLGEAVLRQVRALPVSARHELLVAEVAAHPHVRLLEPKSILAAEQAAIIAVDQEGAIAFRHPLFAWAVGAIASRAELKVAHVRVAERTVYPEERLRHLALAADAPNPELARDLEEMAGVLRERGAPGSSAEFLALSRRLTPAEMVDQWASRCAGEIALLYEAGDWVEAWALGQEALERLPPGPARAAVLLEAAARRPASADLCHQALEEADGDLVLTIRGRLVLALQHLYGFAIPASLEQLETAVERARDLGDPRLLAAALTQLGSFRFLGGIDDPLPPLYEATRVERELGSSSAPVGMSAGVYIAAVRICTNELDVARTMLEALFMRAVETGDEGSQAHLRGFLAWLETRAGNWQRARELLDESIRLADLMEFEQGRGERRAWLAALQAEQGDFDTARTTIAEALAICTAIGDKYTLLLCHSVLACIEMDSGHPQTALEHTERIREILPESSAPLWLDFEGTEIEALIAVGNTDDAAQRLEALRRLTRAHPFLQRHIRVAHATSLLLASQDDLVGAATALQQLAADLDLRHAPFEHARTLLLKGRLERRNKHKSAARDAFEEAAAIFEQLGAPARAERCRAETMRLGLRRTTHTLTESEQRVADLAATGKKNREIAVELFISRRTVEATLARVYKKLNVTSRAELIALLGPKAEASPPA
jgi:DNA-binding NarL/FixJ family response regulator